MLKLKQPRVYGFIEVLFDSTPDLLSCWAVHNYVLDGVGERTKKPRLNNLVLLKPELMVEMQGNNRDWMLQKIINIDRNSL